MSEIKARSISGARWVGIERVAFQLSSLTIGIFLARILGPEDFGLLALVTVVTTLFEIFGNFGIASAIVQKKLLSSSMVHSAFWGSLIMGVILCLILILFSGELAEFYNEPMLKHLTQVMSINLVLLSIALIPESLLRK